jgi:hypothetical protein
MLRGGEATISNWLDEEGGMPVNGERQFSISR